MTRDDLAGWDITFVIHAGREPPCITIGSFGVEHAGPFLTLSEAWAWYAKATYRELTNATPDWATWDDPG